MHLMSLLKHINLTMGSYLQLSSYKLIAIFILNLK